MSAQARKVHRILAVQQQLYRIEEWKLADLERTLERLEVSQREVIGALNEDDALQGLFLDAMARRLRSLGEEASRVGQQREQSARLLEHGARKSAPSGWPRPSTGSSRGRPTRRSSSMSSSGSSALPHKPPARLPGDGGGRMRWRIATRGRHPPFRYRPRRGACRRPAEVPGRG
jgi:hypothetical protein